MQVNRESNLMVNTPPVPVSNNGLVVSPSPLEKNEKNEKNENLETSEKSTKRVSHQSVEQDLSDEKRVQNELHTGSVDFEDSEKIALMSDLRDLKAPSALSESDDSDLLMNEPVKLKQENKTALVESQTSETQMEKPMLLDLDNLLPPELPLLTDLRTETQSKNVEGSEKTSQQATLKEVETESKFEAKTETKFPSWTKNNLSSLVQAQFKKQLTAWDASGIFNTRAKQSKALVSQAQKLSAEILTTPGFKEMFFEKSDTELRDALADAVGQLKKNDPKFKNLKDSSYQSLPKDKQAFVDAILTGLKAGLTSNLLSKVGKQKGVTEQQVLNKSELMGEIEKRRDQKISPEGLKALGELDEARQKKDLKFAQNQKILNKSELMGEIEKRRDQHLNPESLKKIEQLDKERQAFDLDFAQDLIKTENQKLEQDTVGNRTIKPVPSTELSDKELQKLMKSSFGESRKTYSKEEIKQAQTTAVKLMQNSKDQQLLWTFALRPQADLLRDVNRALHGKVDNLSDDQNLYTNKIIGSFRAEALKQLEGKGSVVKRGKDSSPKEVKFNGKTYTHVTQLGKGSFGTAHLFESTNKKTKQTEQIVVKQFSRRYSDANEWFGKMQQEIRAHQYAMGLDGKGQENVLALKGVLFDSKAEGLGEFMTVSEVAGKGSLKDVSEKIDTALDNKELTPTVHQLLKRSLLAQAMDGMKYVQSQRDMLHLDLKPDNIFVTGEGKVKIADFGTSSIINETSSEDGIGTPLYMSPENTSKKIDLLENPLKKRSLNTGSDVWSLGVMARELLTGNRISPELQKKGYTLDTLTANPLFKDTTEFSSDDNNRIYQQGSQETRLGHEKKVEVKSLGAYEKVINAMMHPDQNKRPTLEALTQHGLFSDQILQEPKLQELLMAVLDGKDAKTIQKLSQEVESLNKRL